MNDQANYKMPVYSASQRWWDLPALLLLLVLITTAYTRLVATGWAEGLELTRTISYLALIAGAALGASRFRRGAVLIFALGYGLFVVPWRLGTLMGEGVEWMERAQSMGGRLLNIFSQLARRQAVTDNFLFLTLMGLLFWGLSLYAAYQLTRYANPWRVILPLGLALVVIHHYDAFLSRRIWYLVVYLFFAIILVARLTFLHQAERWKNTNTYMPPYLGVDFVRIALSAAALLLVLSWTAPALADSLPAAREAWQRAFREPSTGLRTMLDNAFASLRSSVGIVSDYYGPTLSLGRGNRLSDSVIFTVLVPEDVPRGIRYYWRARVYDEYANGWNSTDIRTQLSEPGEIGLNLADSEDNALGQYAFSFSLGTPISTLLTPYQTTWLSRPARIELTMNPDGSADVASLRAAPPLRAGESYNVRAVFNDVTVKALREAGSDYPEWVRERYLQLPDAISQRTRDLARALAENRETHYDVVVSITGYLRANIEYSETVPPLPPNQDLVDWFLFDVQRGFCNYYATAEVMMLRSLGIPARLAVGYAQGEPLEVENGYLVRQREAHAWPEVYFPGIGWVEFEPTASQPVLVRPLGEDAGAGSEVQPDLPGADEDLRDLPAEEQDPTEEIGGTGLLQNDTVRNLIVLGGSLALAVILIALLVPFARRRKLHEKLPLLPLAIETGMRRIGLQPPQFLKHWASLARLAPIARAYHEINLALDRMGEKPSLDSTPIERTQALCLALPQAETSANTLLHEYQSAVYTRQQAGDLQTAQLASREIRRLSWRAFFQRLFTSERGSSRRSNVSRW